MLFASNMSSYGKWTVEKLKTELNRRGAHTKSRKEDLINRLEAYVRNDDFRGELVSMPMQIIPDWPSSGFRQLVSEHRHLLPKLSEGQIEVYLNHRAAVDKLCMSDLKALEKGKLMFESKRIDACSVHISQDDLYFTGIVKAAMKKKVSYNFKLRISRRSGEVINSHCECPAGKGPHGTCKHVACVLLMLQSFAEGSDAPTVNKTCTENLQTFHKPRCTHDGSPIRAEDLPTKQKPSMSDPRPMQYRNLSGYQDHVRNLVLNFCANTGQDLALRYIYPKADILTATKDHDYLPLPLTEYWVDNALLVTKESAQLLEVNTRTQAKCKLWHIEHITASRFGDIAHATERGNREKLCQSIVFPPSLSGAPVVHGKQYEPVAVKQFESMYNLNVQKCGLFVLPELPYLGASPDGVIDNDTIVEIKCPYVGKDSEIVPGKMFPFLEYTSNGVVSLKKQSSYYCQVQGQLYLSRSKTCYFIVYTHKDLLLCKVNLDRDYCEISMLPKLELFYKKYLRPFIAGHF